MDTHELSPAPDAGDIAQSTETGLQKLIGPAAQFADTSAIIAKIDALVAEQPQAADARASVLGYLCDVLHHGRQEIGAALLANPCAGLRIARTYAHVTDAVLTGVVHFTSHRLHPAPIRTKAEQLAVVAVGGYGRGEMAPFSDVDLLFVMPYKQTAWGESVVESTLYLLWDLKLKIGYSVRSINDCIRLARDDITIRTSLLEQRFICGDRDPFDELDTALWGNLYKRSGPEFVEAKLAERDERHEKHGGSRYLLEPNLKESKGGLRDLQTLYWISRYLFHTDTAWELVEMGVFEHEEVQTFADAAKFIWAVRCHLHDLSGRAQEQLTFDRQTEIAARMGYQDDGGRMAVEHFMHAYFRHAKAVGDLTRIFAAALETQHAKAQPVLSSLLQALSFRSNRPGPNQPFVVTGGRLNVRDDQVFVDDPVNLLRLFHSAARMDAHVHPAAMRLVTQSLDLIDEHMRNDPAANTLFLDMLCDGKKSERLLRKMNETGILGRFVPEFGRIVAMMQFNMYHHYTVDEHIIRTIGVLNKIECLELQEEHPYSSSIIKAGFNRRVLYMALFLHDVGKGSTRDHSELGAEIAARVCPRFGLDEAETDLVVWLIRHHLAMSDTAQKRDIADPRTVRDFAKFVQSPMRLRLLLVLTVCDICGVGPGVWNNWKAQLLRGLYSDTRDVLTGGAEQASRAHRVDVARTDCAHALGDWPDTARQNELTRHYAHYWLGFETQTHVIFAEMARAYNDKGMITRFLPDESRDATMACLYMPDHPGLFARMAGAFAMANANVVDARTYTTHDGMATSAFWIQDDDGKPFASSRLPRLSRTIEQTLAGERIASEVLRQRQNIKARERQFNVPTRIVFDNEASDLYTVIEVNARDRLGLLHKLAYALTSLNINIFSAIIATYGEHAVDVFYVKDLFGLKIRSPAKRARIERKLIAAARFSDKADAS